MTKQPTFKTHELDHDTDCGVNDLAFRDTAEPRDCTCGAVVCRYETALAIAEQHRNAVLESAALVADQVDDCFSSGYDSGGAEDGYRQAKSQIADAIRALKVNDKPERGTEIGERQALGMLRDGIRNMGNQERVYWKQRVEAFLSTAASKSRTDCPRYDECERGTAECYCVEA